MRLVSSFVTLFFFLFSFATQATNEKILCGTYFGIKNIKHVQNLKNDKTKHCSLSCFMATKCPDSEVYIIGYLKEIWDYLGNGTPDSEDMKANEKGIELSEFANNMNECKSLCLEIYPEE